jgi:hypothetical protein
VQSKPPNPKSTGLGFVKGVRSAICQVWLGESNAWGEIAKPVIISLCVKGLM